MSLNCCCYHSFEANKNSSVVGKQTNCTFTMIYLIIFKLCIINTFNKTCIWYNFEICVKMGKRIVFFKKHFNQGVSICQKNLKVPGNK